MNTENLNRIIKHRNVLTFQGRFNDWVGWQEGEISGRSVWDLKNQKLQPKFKGMYHVLSTLWIFFFLTVALKSLNVNVIRLSNFPNVCSNLSLLSLLLSFPFLSLFFLSFFLSFSSELLSILQTYIILIHSQRCKLSLRHFYTLSIPSRAWVSIPAVFKTGLIFWNPLYA